MTLLFMVVATHGYAGLSSEAIGPVATGRARHIKPVLRAIGNDVSEAADNVHELGVLAGLAMPSLYDISDPALDEAHAFCRSSSWLIPGYGNAACSSEECTHC